VGAASSRDYRGKMPLPQKIIVPIISIKQTGIPKYFGRKFRSRSLNVKRGFKVYNVPPVNNTSTPTPAWYVYIVRCRDGTLYTGITTSINRRIEEHNRGKGCKYTASRHPVKLAYSEPHGDRSSALKREAQIKQYTRGKKESLIKGSIHK